MKDNEIIINNNVKEAIKVDIGDTLLFKVDDNLTFDYKVVGIADSYMGLQTYTSRHSLSTKLGLKQDAYTRIYSNDERYNNLKNLDPDESRDIALVLNIDDLKTNVYNQMKTYNGSVYFVIAFAAIMALIIIAVIANIVVTENQKTISLMKVMGYKNKQISGIVLNIYTPFVIAAYLLSIPVMIKILKWVISLLVADMDMAIPITLSFKEGLIGLIGLLGAYYIAIMLSKKALNKIPLAVALKRE